MDTNQYYSTYFVLPINSNQLAPSLKELFTSLGDFNVVPNPITYILDDKSISEPYKEATNYGMEKSVFWINIGKNITIFFLILAAWPFIFLLSKFRIGKLAIKFISILGNYRYSVFSDSGFRHT